MGKVLYNRKGNGEIEQKTCIFFANMVTFSL